MFKQPIVWCFYFHAGFVGIKYDCATPKVADQEFDNGTMKLIFF